jgi:hypothetical protein
MGRQRVTYRPAECGGAVRPRQRAVEPRNQFVAEALRDARIGTLLFDLLTAVEPADRDNVFDIDFLAPRCRCRSLEALRSNADEIVCLEIKNWNEP